MSLKMISKRLPFYFGFVAFAACSPAMQNGHLGEMDPNSLAQHQREDASTAQAQLANMTRDIESVEKYVERYELGRLIVLKNQLKEVSNKISTLGLAHMGTIREYQVLIVHFRYSSSYLNRISTDATAPLITKIMAEVEKIIKARGFDDSPYTQISLGIFTQMHKLVQDLMALPIDAELKEELSSLLPDLGNVIALSKQGDRPKTFAASTALYKKIRSLYPKFVKVTATQTGFETINNIQGLAEFYAEFGQIED